MDESSFVEVKVVSGDHDAKGLRFTKVRKTGEVQVISVT